MKSLAVALFLLASISAFASELCVAEETIDLTTSTIYVEFTQEKYFVNLPVENMNCVSVMKKIIQKGEFSSKFEGIPVSIIYTIPFEEGSSGSLKEEATKKGLSVEIDLSNREILISKGNKKTS